VTAQSSQETGHVTTPGVVGRQRELELLRAAVTAGRDVLLEGPPGTSKTTMLRAITADWGVPLMFVEGNADLTTGKLVGHHAPDRVLREGYLAENFIDGPLVEAMRLGGFLYIEELNRSPQDTLNTLLSAIGDRRLTIPRIGTIIAKPTFRLVASMNPFDNVGTMRISMSIYDRLCRLAVGYQDEALEREIVEQRASSDDHRLQRDDRLVSDAVALVRATRDHPDVRHGSSVRGAIDTVLVALELGRSRQVIIDLPGTVRRPGVAYRALVLDAITVALSGRIQLDPTAVMTPEQVLHDIWEAYFLSLSAAAGGENAVAADSPLQRNKTGDPKAPFRRKPKTLDEPPQLFVPSPNGQDGGVALRSAGALPPPPPARADERTMPSQSDDEGELQPLDEVAADTEVARRAQEIASRLALVRRRDRRPRSGGRGVLQSAPFDGGSDEIDLDATMDALLETPDIAPEDVVVRTRLLHPRAIALLVDISGSMRGERVRTAAATVGALAGEMEDDQLAVVAFWSDAALLLPLGERVEPGPLMETLLRLPARGLTNVGFPLEIAAKELAGARTTQTRAILLSDCVHNAGADPVPLAAGLARLDILLDVSGEHDALLARELAQAGRGRFSPVRTHRDVAPALDAIFDE
jgi:MoxR-like ATPase/Mg-chelatase subunit ChlD